jgi:hypothetical protein
MLSAIEQRFIEEANAGGFLPDIDADGFPYALGAHHTGGLFSMEIKESLDRHSDGSIYELADGVIADILDTERAEATTARRTSR